MKTPGGLHLSPPSQRARTPLPAALTPRSAAVAAGAAGAAGAGVGLLAELRRLSGSFSGSMGLCGGSCCDGGGSTLNPTLTLTLTPTPTLTLTLTLTRWRRQQRRGHGCYRRPSSTEAVTVAPGRIHPHEGAWARWRRRRRAAR